MRTFLPNPDVVLITFTTYKTSIQGSPCYRSVIKPELVRQLYQLAMTLRYQFRA